VILRRLKEYADTRMQLPPVMYAEVPVRWFGDLDQDGNLQGFTPRGGDTNTNRRGEILILPQIVRTRKIKPKLLADNGEYVLGAARPGSDTAKVVERHSQFVELARRCAEETGEPSIKAVVRFLDGWNIENEAHRLPDGFDPTDNLTFRVGGVIPAVELESVQSFWAIYTVGADNPVMNCLVTGQAGPVEPRLPVKVKGLTRIGGQSSGTSLVSANEPAFVSYGLANSLTSPISRDAAERYGKALNHLLGSEETRIYIGPSAYVFWTREESDFSLNVLDNPEPEDVKRLLESPYRGREERGLRANDFYALALSASGGRAVVRDWLETTVPAAEENLRRWFRAQRIVNPYGELGEDAARALGVYALTASVYRDPHKEIIPQVPAALVRVALNGGPLPDYLLARAVARNQAGTVFPNGARENVTYARAALLKLVLSYGGEDKMSHTMEKLDTEHKEPAYHCGRLLAELEALQRAAIPGVKATLVDRYYGSASSTPAAVFGTLLSHAQAHLGKLRKSPGGAGPAIQRRMEEIMANLDEFPRTLTLREQAVFALGYYHQRAENRAQRSAAVEARKESREES
jgi:CRISPR-associated protein Csd1